MFQVDPGLLPPDLIHIHKVRPDVVDHRVEGNSILPALAKVFDLKAIFPVEVGEMEVKSLYVKDIIDLGSDKRSLTYVIDLASSSRPNRATQWVKSY